MKSKTEPKKSRKRALPKAVGGFFLSLYLPKFVRIHFRYVKHSFRVWAALFVAPFLAIKLSLITVFNWLAEESSSVWKFDLIAIFAVAVCFVLAERHRKFRQFYVYAAPIVMMLGLLHWAGDGSGYLSLGYAVKGALIVYFSYRVGRFTISTGYQKLTDGADKDYIKGREHYDGGAYDLALPLLEKAAKRGHFKSLYFIGDAYENGHFYEADLVKAAEHYKSAGRKGYAKANDRFQEILNRMTDAEKDQIKYDWFEAPS